MAENPYLDQISAGFEPIAGYQPVQLPQQFPDLPAMGPVNPIMQMFGPGVMQQMGLNAFGSGQMNPYDAMWRQQEYELQMRMMQNSIGLEREQYMRTAAGVYAMRGMQFGGPERAAFMSAFDPAANMAMPLIPMYGTYFDQLAGQYGSPMTMAYGMSTAAPYRFDPITGQMGMRLSTMQFQHGQLFDEMFLHGDAAERYGVRAGDVGMMYGELGRRGLLPGGDVRRDALSAMNPTRLGRLAQEVGVDTSGGIGNLTNQQLTQLMQSDVLRNEVAFFDGDRVKESLKGFSEVISAMRDLMGANGDPDAPLPKIMRNLDAITQSMSTQFSPQQVAQTVRMTHQLTQMTGMSIDGAMLMQGHISGQLDAAGLPGVVAPQMLQGTLAFGGALRGNGIPVGWGQMSADQLQQLDANLRVGAFNSQTGNRLGAFLRAREAMGGFTGDAELRANALINGDASEANMSDAEYMALMATQGISSGQARGYLGQRFANQRLSAAHNLQNLVTSPEVQGREFSSFLDQNARRYMTSALIAQGRSPEEAKAMANAASSQVIDAYVGMSGADFANPAARNAQFGRIFQSEFGMDSRAAGVMAEGLVGDWDAAIQRSSYRGLENTLVAHTMFDQTVRGSAGDIYSQAQARERVQAAMAGMGDNSVLRRAITALQGADAETGIDDVLKKAVGNVAPEDVLKRSGKDLQRLAQLDSRAQELLQQLSDASPSERARIMGDLDSAMREFSETKSRVSAEFGDAGISEEDNPLTGEQLRRAVSSAEVMRQSREALRGEAPEDWAAYWNDPEKGGKFAEQVNLAAENGADAFNRAMLSSSDVRSYGAGLIESSRDFYGGQHELQQLADEFASGDVRRLLAGDFADAGRSDVQSRIDNALGRQDKALKFLKRAGSGFTPQERAEALLRLEGGDMSESGALAKGALNAHKLGSGGLAAYNKTNRLREQLDRLASYHGVSSDDVMAAVRGENSPFFDELNNDDRKKGLLRVGNELLGAENTLAAEAAKVGLTAEDARAGGEYASRLEAARSRESALYYGDGEALISEFETLSGLELNEGDASLRSAVTSNRSSMIEAVGNLRTIRSITGNDDPRGFINDMRTMLAYDKPKDAERQRKMIMQRYGLNEDQIAQASGAVQGLNQGEFTDVLNAGAGGEDALRRLLTTGNASEKPQEINVNFSGSNVKITIDGKNGQIDGTGRGRRR